MGGTLPNNLGLALLFSACRHPNIVSFCECSPTGQLRQLRQHYCRGRLARPIGGCVWSHACAPPSLSPRSNVDGICHTPPAIITEYCANGSLAELLGRARRDPAVEAALSWPRRITMLLHAAVGMLYLHSRPRPICHRDLVRAGGCHALLPCVVPWPAFWREIQLWPCEYLPTLLRAPQKSPNLLVDENWRCKVTV